MQMALTRSITLGGRGAMTRDFRCEFRNLYDRVDHLHLTLSQALTQIQEQDPTETRVREHLAAHRTDLVKVLRDHVEAFIESFGSLASGPSTDTRRNVN